ncbi:MAG: GspH/FimT family pseudopilin [Proteobacteria bacterium]|nr:GspH/FimT family pseudopilin [Pseudomonadota bacterium]
MASRLGRSGGAVATPGTTPRMDVDLHDRPAARRAERGFTLPELLIALTIVGILLGIGVPSYINYTNANRVAGEINGLLYDLQYARAEAIKEGRSVTVCASFDGQTCLGWPYWGWGWIVFQDPNGNQVIDGGEARLRSQAALKNNDSLWPDFWPNWVPAITFNREGYAVGLAGTLTFHLHDNQWNNQNTRCLQVTIVGQTSTERFGQANCNW